MGRCGMALRIGLAYNEKPPEEEDPPGSPSHDRYAEWDDPATIAAVEAALSRLGDVTRLEATDDFPFRLRAERPDLVFNMAEGLNGPNREAHVPAFCEFFDIPFTGSDALTLGLALDKRRAKEVLLARGVPTAPHLVMGDGADALPGRGLIPLPAMVKPLHEGSSKGIDSGALCESETAVLRRVQDVVARYDQPALVEAFLPGREFTCAVLGNGPQARVLPIVEMNFAALPAGAPPIYGYEAKWLWDDPARPIEIYHCPATVDATLRSAVEAAALGAFHALGCRDWARVDVRLDADGRPHVIEVNPLPGILPDPAQHSCYPMAARAAGLGYDDMIAAVVNAARARYGLS